MRAIGLSALGLGSPRAAGAATPPPNPTLFAGSAFDHAGGGGRARDERHEPDETAAVVLERRVDHRVHA